ncbi:hypothetical protein HDV05_004236 [Chytridiales sp. JEL 0842]|nr:hypothetical protein HDV05_004236 [Chytridiales sp. JEL 0842]
MLSAANAAQQAIWQQIDEGGSDAEVSHSIGMQGTLATEVAGEALVMGKMETCEDSVSQPQPPPSLLLSQPTFSSPQRQPTDSTTFSMTRALSPTPSPSSPSSSARLVPASAGSSAIPLPTLSKRNSNGSLSSIVSSNSSATTPSLRNTFVRKRSQDLSSIGMHQPYPARMGMSTMGILGAPALNHHSQHHFQHPQNSQQPSHSPPSTRPPTPLSIRNLRNPNNFPRRAESLMVPPSNGPLSPSHASHVYAAGAFENGHGWADPHHSYPMPETSATVGALLLPEQRGPGPLPFFLEMELQGRINRLSHSSTPSPSSITSSNTDLRSSPTFNPTYHPHHPPSLNISFASNPSSNSTSNGIYGSDCSDHPPPSPTGSIYSQWFTYKQEWRSCSTQRRLKLRSRSWASIMDRDGSAVGDGGADVPWWWETGGSVGSVGSLSRRGSIVGAGGAGGRRFSTASTNSAFSVGAGGVAGGGEEPVLRGMTSSPTVSVDSDPSDTEHSHPPRDTVYPPEQQAHILLNNPNTTLPSSQSLSTTTNTLTHSPQSQPTAIPPKVDTESPSADVPSIIRTSPSGTHLFSLQFGKSPPKMSEEPQGPETGSKGSSVFSHAASWLSPGLKKKEVAHSSSVGSGKSSAATAPLVPSAILGNEIKASAPSASSSASETPQKPTDSKHPRSPESLHDHQHSLKPHQHHVHFVQDPLSYEVKDESPRSPSQHTPYERMASTPENSLRPLPPPKKGSKTWAIFEAEPMNPTHSSHHVSPASTSIASSFPSAILPWLSKSDKKKETGGGDVAGSKKGEGMVDVPGAFKANPKKAKKNPFWGPPSTSTASATTSISSASSEPPGKTGTLSMSTTLAPAAETLVMIMSPSPVSETSSVGGEDWPPKPPTFKTTPATSLPWGPTPLSDKTASSHVSPPSTTKAAGIISAETTLTKAPPSASSTTTAPVSSGLASVSPPTKPVIPVVLPKEIIANRYSVTRTVGVGSFSKVKHATDIQTGKPVALKMVSRRMLESNQRVRVGLEGEVEIMSALKHPHMVEFIERIDMPDYVCLVVEFVAGGELFDYIADHKDKLTINEVRRLFKELVLVVKYLHDNMIAHRDLKIENVLLTSTETPHIKLADFGFAVRLLPPTPPTEGTDDGVSLLTARCGSEEYAAPEIVLAQPYDGRKTDIWALGVILFAMMTGELPFIVEPGQKPRVMYHKIARLEYHFPETSAEAEKGKELSEEEKMGRDLVKAVFQGPKGRITIKEMLEHPFLKDVKV